VVDKSAKDSKRGKIMTKEELIEHVSARQFMVISTFGGEYPESACVEFGNDGLTIIFDTNNGSRKYQNILKNPKVSLVIGWEDERTAQYEGTATLLENGPELERLKQVYFEKSPKAQKWETTEGNVYFKVEPAWIRFTDLNTDPWDITVFDGKGLVS
jgi:nitroimidazol reductase NimA-like FMN-containing flavoprotein (pyridoxamine 5'-phosphate oxidase superfamily)